MAFGKARKSSKRKSSRGARKSSKRTSSKRAKRTGRKASRKSKLTVKIGGVTMRCTKWRRGGKWSAMCHQPAK